MGADVEGVGDELHADAVVGERSAHHAGIAVHQRGLGVEQVGHVAHARVDGLLGLGVGGGGVAHGDQGLARHLTNAVQIAGHLRGDGEHADDVQILLQEGRVAGADVLARLRALLAGVDEGALGVHAQNLRALPAVLRGFLHAPANLGEGCAQLVVGDGHGGGQEAGHAVLRHALRHGADAVKGAVGRVLAQIAVDVHVQQARNHVVALRVDALGLRGNLGFGNQAQNLAVIQQRGALHKAIRQHDLSIYDGKHEFTPHLRFIFGGLWFILT